MKPFCNRGWKWLCFIEKILPVAGATGSHSYVATEANPPSLACDADEQLEPVQALPFPFSEVFLDFFVRLDGAERVGAAVGLSDSEGRTELG